jgi:hypothetical protein
MTDKKHHPHVHGNTGGKGFKKTLGTIKNMELEKKGKSNDQNKQSKGLPQVGGSKLANNYSLSPRGVGVSVERKRRRLI